MTIVRGTTPTIRYSFSTINISDLSVAKLVIFQDEAVITKDLSEGSVGVNYVEWTLSQTDTLALIPSVRAIIKLDWLLSDGTRGVGNTMLCSVGNSAINEVLNV